MARPFNATRRRHYSPRRHDVDTRREPMLVDDGRSVWYRGPEGDHAFPVTSGYLRSRCKAVRWDTRMQLIEGTVHPCRDCELLVNGTEGEKREAFGA